MKALVLLLAACLAAQAQSRYVRIPAGGNVAEPFLMGRTEVTVREFAAFVKTTGYRTLAEKDGAPRTWKTPGFAVSARQPVVYVAVQDAAAYCAWDGGRLPKDEEWEHAARAGARTVHYWGDSIDGRYLWYRANSNDRPQAVARKLPNAWGLYDMEGNVWEWTEAAANQNGAMARRRGGSWVDCEFIDAGPTGKPSLIISLERYYSIPVKLNHRYDDIGFRCVRNAR